jgi:histidinol dehydrogenase
MSEVKRYGFSYGNDFDERNNGAYVTHKDYAALQQKLDAVLAENVALKDAIPNLKDVDYGNDNMDDVSLAEYIGFNDAVTLMNRWKSETPATEAILSEVRAEGANAVAKYHNERFKFLANTCRASAGEHKAAYLCALDVAAQLRTGSTEGATND